MSSVEYLAIELKIPHSAASVYLWSKRGSLRQGPAEDSEVIGAESILFHGLETVKAPKLQSVRLLKNIDCNGEWVNVGECVERLLQILSFLLCKLYCNASLEQWIDAIM